MRCPETCLSFHALNEAACASQHQPFFTEVGRSLNRSASIQQQFINSLCNWFLAAMSILENHTDCLKKLDPQMGFGRPVFNSKGFWRESQFKTSPTPVDRLVAMSCRCCRRCVPSTKLVFDLWWFSSSVSCLWNSSFAASFSRHVVLKFGTEALVFRLFSGEIRFLCFFRVSPASRICGTDASELFAYSTLAEWSWSLPECFFMSIHVVSMLQVPPSISRSEMRDWVSWPSCCHAEQEASSRGVTWQKDWIGCN